MTLLEGILSRLKNMVEKEEEAERYFEQNGVKKCKVAYHPKTTSFELKIYNEDGTNSTYQFDNLDMVAIEIFDVLSLEV